MLLLLAGLYYLITGRCQISGKMSLEGTGARLAGGACILMALGFLQFLGMPILQLAIHLGMAAYVTVISLVLQLATMAIIIAILLKVYGNTAKTA